jgi:GTP-binding protein
MKILSAEYVGSSPGLKGCPQPDKPEYAFCGRSNVGKSSLINMITARKSLAKTSSTPGKTKTINHFIINNEWYLADLPGLGYAKTSHATRQQWEKYYRDYLKKRENLMCVFHLTDIRIPPQKSDLESFEFMGKEGIPFVIVFTKTDGLKRNALLKQTELFRAELEKYWDELPDFFFTSSSSGEGRDELLSFISETNSLFQLAY